ncbi:MAG: hypothetical protein M1814_000934, partial [Vezdaea aestivalis]
MDEGNNLKWVSYFVAIGRSTDDGLPPVIAKDKALHPVQPNNDNNTTTNKLIFDHVNGESLEFSHDTPETELFNFDESLPVVEMDNTNSSTPNSTPEAYESIKSNNENVVDESYRSIQHSTSSDSSPDGRDKNTQTLKATYTNITEVSETDEDSDAVLG